MRPSFSASSCKVIKVSFSALLIQQTVIKQEAANHFL